MRRPQLPDPPPVTLDVVPSALREVPEDERRALDFAAGSDPLAAGDAVLAAFAAVVLLLGFALGALLR